MSEPARPAPQLLPDEERNLRILIIDDNPAIHEDVRKVLGAPAREDADLDAEAAALFGEPVEAVTATHFEIDSAYQGQEGLEMVERASAAGRPYAMAFVDVRMPPGWDGIETIERIWKAHPELQIVICTAYSDYSWEDMIRAVGSTDSLVILKKPFDNIEVLQLAHALTRKWMLGHRLQTHLAGLDEIVAARTAELQAANARLRQEMNDRVQAEAELGKSEERFQKAFNSSPIPKTIQQIEGGQFIDVNTAFLALIGFTRAEVIGRTPEELGLCPDPVTQGELFRRLREGESVRNHENQLQPRAASQPLDCLVAAEAFELSGDLVALIATLDVSEQRRLEKELRHSQKLEAVGQFAAGVAHDFNNLLTVIQGHASIQLARQHLDADMAESLGQVSQAAERAAGLTRQLLAFSRKQVVQLRALDLNETIRGIEDMIRRLLGTDLEFRCELSEKPLIIRADQGNIEQVLVNLCVNARDAMLDGGWLIVSTRQCEIAAAPEDRHPRARPGTFACLTVADTGCGMSPETLGHIFEPFFTTKEQGKGTGLGLATVHGIVAQQGGWIEVESAPGDGARLSVFLPLSTETATLRGQPEPGAALGGDETILVVEDEPDVRELMTSVLRQHGYHIFEAADGVEALGIWKNCASEIDLLVTDIVMPNGIRGSLLAQRLQSERPGLPVIFSSGYSPEFATGNDELGERFDFLQKPYKPAALIQAVRRNLDRIAAA